MTNDACGMNRTGIDNGVSGTTTTRTNDAQGNDDGLWRPISLADGMKRLILEFGFDACQANLDEFRRAPAASSGGGDGDGGGGCPMSNSFSSKSKVPATNAVPPAVDESKEECITCSGDTDTSVVQRMVASRREALQLAYKLEHDADLNHHIIEASFDGVFLVNEYGIIRTVNESALSQFGYDSPSELVGRNIRVICGQKHASMHDAWMERYRLTREDRMIGSQREVFGRRKDGSEFPCKIGIKVMQRCEGSKDELLMAGFIRDLTVEKRAIELAAEAKAADKLLFNMLPKEIALRLRDDPHAPVADHYDSATTIFADLAGFTSMSSSMTPIEVVKILNGLFGRFDNLVDRYHLNKIKTLGDGYLATSIPVSKKSPAEMAADVCHFGLDMLEELHQWSNEQKQSAAAANGRNDDDDDDTPPVELRVGINSGPVVAGIVGKKRIMFDIWGDSVNVAARMESTGVRGKVQVTQAVVDLVESFGVFKIEKRGLVDVKGKGSILTYFISR